MNVLELRQFNKSVHLSSGLLMSAPQGKMAGIMCLTTSPLDNPRCIARHKCDINVCKACFSLKSLAFKKNVRNAYHSNSMILSQRDLTQLELHEISYLIKFYNIKYFRFESHGDLINDLHYINYVEIAKNNPDVNFALWSKNFDIIEHVEKYSVYKKPNNLILVQSSVKLNEPETQASELATKVFTVYDKDFIKNNNVSINCGGNKCMDCLKCYQHNDIYTINERLK